MQRQENAVCRVMGMQYICRERGPIMCQHAAESPAYRLVLYCIMHIQRAATGECSMQSEGNAE